MSLMNGNVYISKPRPSSPPPPVRSVPPAPRPKPPKMA